MDPEPAPSRRRLLGTGLALGVAGSAAGCAPSVPAAATRATAASQTPSGAAPGLRLVAASDAHVGEAGTDSVEHLEKFVDAVNRLHASTPFDVVVVNGDIGHGGTRRLRHAKRLLDRLAAPYLAVPGNHDGVSPDEWKQVWGTPENQVLRVGSRSIVAANTSDERGDYLCADASWLHTALTAEAGQEDVFVFLHITPRAWTKYGIDCPRTRALLAGTANVRAVFNGHDHDHDEIRTDSGLPYLFDAHIGGSWGTAYRGFRVAEVGAGTMRTRMVGVGGEEFPQNVLTWAG